eukprot:274602_1
MATTDNETVDLKERLATLEKENNSLHEQLKALQSSIAKDDDASESNTIHERAPKEHPYVFFEKNQITDHLRWDYDNDFVKKLIDDGTVTMNDVIDDGTAQGTTLLMLAARAGNYEMTQLCLNLGADINHRNDSGKSAMDFARRHPHIEMLLMLHSLDANVGDRINDKSADLNKEEGIIENILSELELIGDQSKKLFENIVLEIMINIISKKKVFDDILLNLCWKIQRERGNWFESELWKAIKSTCHQVIQSRNKRDWFWMKRCLVPSNIWYKEEDETDEKKYLYYKLLGFVADESQNQLNRLKNNLQTEAGANKIGWNTLVEFGIENDQLTELKPRQEVKTNDLERIRGQCKGQSDGKGTWIDCDCTRYIGPATQGDESHGAEDYCQTPGCNHLPHRHNKEWLKIGNGSQMDPNQRLVRQDLIPNGITAEYTENELNHNATNAKFIGTKFYDLNQYLSKLSLLAQIVDEPFQKSVQNIFNIDNETNIGQIKKRNGDEKDNSDKESEAFVVYKRGPVKLLSRARSKAETDYFNEPYPKSAAVLDLNRCSLIFKDIASLLIGLDVFIASVSRHESDSILSIVRCKNGFKEYVKSVQYADIKLNVLIGGKSNNIIGEVQFLLETMVSYKNAAHSLYAIEREEEFVSNTASKILPLLTDHKKQQKMHTILDNSSGLSELIVFSNLNIKDTLANDPELINRMSSGGGMDPPERVFKLLVSMMTDEEKTTHLLKENSAQETLLDKCVLFRDIALVSALLKVDIVVKAYKENEEKLAQILHLLFTSNPAMAMIDLVATKLDLDNATVGRLMKTKNIHSFAEMAKYGPFIIGAFKRLSSIMGPKVFAECLVSSRAVEVAIIKNGFGYHANAKESAIIKYFLSLEDVVNLYQNNACIHTMLCALFVECIDDDIIDLAVKALDFPKDKVVEVLKSKLEQPEEYYDEDWSHWNVVGRIISLYNQSFPNLKRLKLLVSYFGKNALIESVFIPDVNNVTPLEYAMCAIRGNYNFDIKVLEYLLSFEEIKNGLLENTEVLWRIVYLISRKSRATLSGNKILNELDLKQEQLAPLIAFECPDDREKDLEEYDRKQYYFGKRITQNDIDKILQWRQAK